MKKILIPIDFSQNAYDAISYALAMEKTNDVKFYFLHVVIPVIVQSIDGSIADAGMTIKLLETAKSKMKNLIQSKNENFKLSGINDIEFETDVRVGEVVSAISKKVDEIGADLIVLGTNGAGHNKIEKLFGTISSSLLNYKGCPIIFVPFGHMFNGIKNVVFATSLRAEDSFYLWKAYKTLEPHRPNLTFLFVNKNGILDTKSKELAEYLVESSPASQSAFRVLNGESFENFIEDYAVKSGAEMILMSKRNKHFFNRIRNPNQTKKVLNKLNGIPLMVIS